MTTFYVTKYALTRGIIKVEAEEPSSDIPDMIVVRGRWYPQYYHGQDWWRTPEEALSRAEKMRERRIVALDQAMTKLRNMEFEVTV